MSEWLFSFVIATVICAAAALGIIEIRWTSKQTLLKRLAQLLRDASHHLDAGTPGLDKVVTSDQRPPDIIVNSTVPQSTPPVPPEHIAYRGSETGWYNVLPARDLIRCIEGDEVISKIIRATRIAPNIFAHDLQPALLNFAEFVQLLPASESHHHANPGGLLAHTLETVLYALTIRTGYLLPLGASAEVIAAQRDFWTYAVFLASLLHDVGKPVADLKIQWKRGKTSEPILWSATAGSLNDCAATEYFVGFKKKSERNYDAHAKLGAMLLQRLVPGSTLASMAHVPAGLQELNQYLGGERNGALHEIVQKADQESTRRNLATGSRARFSSARAVPLIERLMGAMTLMFVEGGHLPLNRDGAAGWVYDDCVWLVAKRLADSVREFILRQEEEEAGFPGDAKNDRLFDAWQEYGCIRINPVTGQAIWRVVVTGTGQAGEIAYKHELSVLCFPVAKVWSDPSQIPEAMSGMIEALPAGSQGKPNRDQQSQRPVENGASASVSVDSPTEPIDTKKVPAPKFVSKDSRAMKNSATADAEDLLDERDTAEAEARNARRDKDRRKQEAESEPETVPAHQNDAEDNESEQSVRQESMPHATSSLVFPVPLPIEKLPVLAQKGAKEPSVLAVDFMKWVQRNLADGSMKHNEAGAPVHFIEYGMALVSPLIFRLYATATEAQSAPSDEDGDFAMRVQRELLRAQWHATAPGGKNVWTLFVSKKGGLVASKLSAVVLKDPRLWVMPVPPPNPFISAKSDSSERQP